MAYMSPRRGLRDFPHFSAATFPFLELPAAAPVTHSQWQGRDGIVMNQWLKMLKLHDE